MTSQIVIDANKRQRKSGGAPPQSALSARVGGAARTGFAGAYPDTCNRCINSPCVQPLQSDKGPVSRSMLGTPGVRRNAPDAVRGPGRLNWETAPPKRLLCEDSGEKSTHLRVQGSVSGHGKEASLESSLPDAELAQREAIKVSVVTEMFPRTVKGDYRRRQRCRAPPTHDRKRDAVLTTEPPSRRTMIIDAALPWPRRQSGRVRSAATRRSPSHGAPARSPRSRQRARRATDRGRAHPGRST